MTTCKKLYTNDDLAVGIIIGEFTTKEHILLYVFW